MTSTRIAGGQGFYGDTPRSVATLLDANVDYLCLEALAELTLAILQKDFQRDESRGYTRDLPLYLGAALPAVVDGRTKVITNAGGINPVAAARAAVDTAKQLGITGVTIATVTGSDCTGRLDELREAGEALAHNDTGTAFADLPGGEVRFAAAYLGARPIVDALEQGADIVITGRVADAALFLAPLVFEHGWAWDDWDRLASGVLLGHLLECSGQSVGGNDSAPGWWHEPASFVLPYPIADVEADGTAVISKPAGTAGRVTFDTVRQQMLYEVQDPTRYLSPDVVADFTSARFTDLGDDRVRVEGVRGAPAPDSYKLLLAHPAGWIGEAKIGFSWPEALAKAKVTAAFFAERVRMAGLPVDEWLVEYWGNDALAGPAAVPVDDPAEIALRVAWRCATKDAARGVAREMTPLTLSGPAAGLTGMGASFGGDARELLGIWPTLVRRELVDPRVSVTLEEVR